MTCRMWGYVAKRKRVVKNLFGFGGSKWKHESTVRTKSEAVQEAKEYSSLGIPTKIRKVKAVDLGGGYIGRYAVYTKARSNPLRKRAKKITKRKTVRAGAESSLRSAEMRALQNPRKVKRSTGWMNAVAVKIVKRRGQPDQVLIRKPGSKKRR